MNYSKRFVVEPGAKVKLHKVDPGSSGHIIRMIAARWLGLPPAAGRCFFCQPGSVGELSFEHDSRDQPIVRLWNYVSVPSTTTSGLVDLVDKAK